MESRKNTESGRKAAESWTGPRTLSPQHIIAFFGDTNYINHAQIRYVCEINHSPSGATRPRVSRFISVYVPIGHDLSNTFYANVREKHMRMRSKSMFHAPAQSMLMYHSNTQLLRSLNFADFSKSQEK